MPFTPVPTHQDGDRRGQPGMLVPAARPVGTGPVATPDDTVVTADGAVLRGGPEPVGPRDVVAAAVGDGVDLLAGTDGGAGTHADGRVTPVAEGVAPTWP